MAENERSEGTEFVGVIASLPANSASSDAPNLLASIQKLCGWNLTLSVQSSGREKTPLRSVNSANWRQKL
jgi:hypothetical protein